MRRLQQNDPHLLGDGVEGVDEDVEGDRIGLHNDCSVMSAFQASSFITTKSPPTSSVSRAEAGSSKSMKDLERQTGYNEPSNGKPRDEPASAMWGPWPGRPFLPTV